MEWHGRTTATDDIDLFTELERLKSESAVILPATSAVISILTDADFPDDDALEDTLEPVPRTSEDITVPAVDTSVAPPSRRNLTSSFVQGAVTRSQTRAQEVMYDDVGHRSDNILFELSSYGRHYRDDGYQRYSSV
ncbi:hypothetical protein MHU86_1315 [Fragilaria crotonensis]|nr:hypothetical protein MHU86_1315 [Fragilaria crotonensis]